MKRKATIGTIAYALLAATFILTGFETLGVLCILVAGFSAIAGLETA